MKRAGLFVFLILTILRLQFAFASVQAEAPLYLSFEQRLFASYALLSANEPIETRRQIARQALSVLKKYSELPVKTIEVANFDEFLKVWQGEWPSTQSLKLDLELIENSSVRGPVIFKSSSPRVQKKIDHYQSTQLQRLSDIMKINTQLMDIGKQIQEDQSHQEIESNLIKYGDQLVNSQLAELDRVGEHIANNAQAFGQDQGLSVLLKTLFSEYYSRLGANSKKLIISSFLGEDLTMDEFHKFSIMVQNSGPQLQKMLQVVARQADLNSTMLELFRRLEDSVRPVPYSQVDEILKAEKDNYHFVSIEKKPLGVGTMAQVHRAKILDKQGRLHNVVVRFLKPGIMDRVEEDHRILIEVAKILDGNQDFRKTGAPKITPIINDISNTVRAEFDLQQTIGRQLLAGKVYNKEVYFETGDMKNKIHFHVPELYRSKGPSNLMVQEMVIGRKLDKEIKTYQEIAPELKKIIVEEMAQLWVEEAIFGQGFYHADLHQGNFLIQVTDPEVQVHILDFGMGGKLTKNMQRQMILLGAGIDLKRTDLMAKAYWNISNKEKTSISFEQLKSQLDEKLKSIQKGESIPLTIEGWTAFVVDTGLALPYDFINMNRGIVIVNKMLKDAGSNKTITGLSREIGRTHPQDIYDALVGRNEISLVEFMKLGIGELTRILSGKSKAVRSSAVSCEMVWD